MRGVGGRARRASSVETNTHRLRIARTEVGSVRARAVVDAEEIVDGTNSHCEPVTIFFFQENSPFRKGASKDLVRVEARPREDAGRLADTGVGSRTDERLSTGSCSRTFRSACTSSYTSLYRSSLDDRRVGRLTLLPTNNLQHSSACFRWPRPCACPCSCSSWRSATPSRRTCAWPPAFAGRPPSSGRAPAAFCCCPQWW